MTARGRWIAHAARAHRLAAHVDWHLAPPALRALVRAAHREPAIPVGTEMPPPGIVLAGTPPGSSDAAPGWAFPMHFAPKKSAPRDVDNFVHHSKPSTAPARRTVTDC